MAKAKKKRLAILEIAGQTIEVDIDDHVDSLIAIAWELEQHIDRMRRLVRDRKRHEFSKDIVVDHAAKATLAEKLIVGYEGVWGS